METVGTVVGCSQHVSLLIEASVVQSRRACRVNVELDGVTRRALALLLDGAQALVVMTAPELAYRHAVGSRVTLRVTVVDGRLPAGAESIQITGAARQGLRGFDDRARSPPRADVHPRGARPGNSP